MCGTDMPTMGIVMISQGSDILILWQGHHVIYYDGRGRTTAYLFIGRRPSAVGGNCNEAARSTRGRGERSPSNSGP